MSGIVISCPFELTRSELEVILKLHPVIVLCQDRGVSCDTVEQACEYIDKAQGLVFLRNDAFNLTFSNLPTEKPYYLLIEQESEVLLVVSIHKGNLVEVWPDLSRQINPYHLGIKL